MAFKDLGPNVSQHPQAITPGAGSYTAEQHSYESMIFQANRPITDWEMNLLQEILGDYGLRSYIQSTRPSGFINGDFYDNTTSSVSFVTLTPDPPTATTANKFQLRASNVVVNGWQIDLNFNQSATDGVNVITLPVPRGTVGSTRIDFVFLEVWRARLAPAPDTANKSASAQIFRDGNINSPDGPPIGNENLADSILDPTFGAETTERVQIQYRFRVFADMDLVTYPDGLDNPLLFAYTTPALGPFPNGSPTSYTYAKHPDDPGLWRAGTGNQLSANALGTVDGYMYAIPICAVYRRNSATFDRNTNLNGGSLMASGTATRPDGFYADQIQYGDIQDLRKIVVSETKEVLQKGIKWLLSNNLSTQGQVHVQGNGGIKFLVRDDVGISQHIGNPDAIRMTFSDRSITESVVAKISIGGVATNTLTINLNSIPVWWQGTVDVQDFVPGASFVGLGTVRIIDTGAGTDKNAFDLVSPFCLSAVFSTVIGPGVDRVVLTLDTPVTHKDIYIELRITYPTGMGCTYNQLSIANIWTPPAANIAAWLDPTSLTPTSDTNRYSLNSSFWNNNSRHREVTVQLPTTPITSVFYNTASNIIYIPEMLTGNVTINDGSNPPYTTINYTVGTIYTQVNLLFSRPVNTPITVTYTALRAAPPVGLSPGDSYQFFYFTNSIQTIPVASGNQSLSLIPRLADDTLYITCFGSGSPDDGPLYLNGGGYKLLFLYPPSNGVPVGIIPSVSYPESALDAPAVMIMNNTAVTTGLMSMPIMAPGIQSLFNVGSPQAFTLTKSAITVTQDAEGRSFWPIVDEFGLFATVASQSFQYPQKHKTIYGVLSELQNDYAPIGRARTLVLTLFTRYVNFDVANNVQAIDSLSDSCIGIYRLPGNPIFSRRTSR